MLDKLKLPDSRPAIVTVSFEDHKQHQVKLASVLDTIELQLTEFHEVLRYLSSDLEIPNEVVERVKSKGLDHFDALIKGTEDSEDFEKTALQLYEEVVTSLERGKTQGI